MALSTLVPELRSFDDPAARLAGLAGAMARHPAAGAPPGPATRVAGFTALVGLLTGAWRVDDPEGFAAAMTGAALIGGHAVLDLAEPQGFSPDPWSIRAWAALRATLGGLAERRTLEVARVSADHAGARITEARARAQAPARGAEVESFVVAHLVEPLDRRRGPGSPAPLDHSWMVLIVGDGSGGVASVARAVVSCPGRPRCCRAPAPWARPALRRLADRLVTPGLPSPDLVNAGVVVPLLRR